MDGYTESSLFSPPNLGAVIVAAGSSLRMGGEDKQFIDLCGVPVLARSMLAFQQCAEVSEIIVAARKECLGEVRALAEKFGVDKLRGVVVGGATRAESVRSGVLALSDEIDFVAIHDGARPLVMPEDISRCAHDAFRYGGAVLAVPATDTVKYGKKNGFVEYTPAREKLFAVQTPQIFNLELYREAMERAFRELSDWTDDSKIFENDARQVFLTPGRRDNIKITTPEDEDVAKALLERRERT